MRNPGNNTRPIRLAFCLCLTCLLLLMTVFAAVPENGNNAAMPGTARTEATDRGTNRAQNSRTGDNNPVMGAVTDAADAVGDMVSDAGDAVGEIGGAVGDVVSDAGDAVGEIGGAVGDVVSDAGDAAGDAADAIGGGVSGNTGTVPGTNADKNTAGSAVPYDDQASAVTPGNPGAAGTVAAQNSTNSFSWVWILILVAAAAAIFFLILMPRQSREM